MGSGSVVMLGYKKIWTEFSQSSSRISKYSNSTEYEDLPEFDIPRAFIS